jgi:hypothetical protein
LNGSRVVDILRQFKAGEPTDFVADDFIHVPISDPALDRIREEFERLADDYLEMRQIPIHWLLALFGCAQPIREGPIINSCSVLKRWSRSLRWMDGGLCALSGVIAGCVKG